MKLIIDVIANLVDLNAFFHYVAIGLKVSYRLYIHFKITVD